MFVALDVIWPWWWQRWRWLGCVCHCVSSRAKVAMIMRALEDTWYGGWSWALEDCCHRIFLSFLSTKVTTLINLGRRMPHQDTRHLQLTPDIILYGAIMNGCDSADGRSSCHPFCSKKAGLCTHGGHRTYVWHVLTWELKKCKHVSQFLVLLCLEISPLPRNILLKRPLAICQRDVTCVFLGCWSSKVIGLGGQDCRWFQCGQRPFVKWPLHVSNIWFCTIRMSLCLCVLKRCYDLIVYDVYGIQQTFPASNPRKIVDSSDCNSGDDPNLGIFCDVM